MWLVVAVAAIVIRAVLVQLRDRTSGTNQAAMVWGGLFILAVLALHSLVDYPLRTQSIAAVAGVAAGLVFAPSVPVLPTARRRLPAVGAVGVAVIAAGLISAEVVRMYAAQADVRAGRGAAAVQLDPSNGSALALAADEELAAHHLAAAQSLAVSAVRNSPLSVEAVRVLAMVADLEHRQGMDAWQLASAMGWRDAPTQFGQCSRPS